MWLSPPAHTPCCCYSQLTLIQTGAPTRQVHRTELWAPPHAPRDNRAKHPSQALSQAVGQSGGLRVASRKVPRGELVGLTPSRGHSQSGWLSFLTPGRCGAQTKGQPECDRRTPRSPRRPQLLLISTKPPSRQFSVSGGS